MSLTLIVLLPFIGAVLPAIMIRAGRNACATATGSVTLLALILLMAKAPAVIAGEVFQVSYSWLPELGLNVTFFLDGLGLLFATLILGIGLLIIIYARFYLSKDDPMGRFYVFLLLFQGAMVGIVLSDNILLLLIFWELTSLSSFLLIGYWKHLPEGRQGARMALAVTGAGGLAMIAGMLILGDIVGSYDLTVILQNADLIQASPMYLPALILILLGCFTKSAQFPFHFWLPHAMAAPTPVSAYLHSATMVKAGIFLMARMWPVLSGTPEWFYIVATAGLVTMVLGAWIAIFKHDLKGLLAYSTVSHLGLVTMLLGFGTPMAAVAGVFHIINHATFKAALFMTAGIVDHETGTRDIRRFGGLLNLMPIAGTIGIITAASMAGIIPLNGFISKEMMLEEAWHTMWLDQNWVVPLLATVGALFSVAYSFRFIFHVWLGKPRDENLPHHPHDPPFGMWAPPALLTVLVVLIGLFPAAIAGPLVAATAGAVIGGELPDYHLSLWHGLTPALGMSVIAIIGGSLLLMRHGGLMSATANLSRPDAKAMFDCGMAKAVALSRLVSDNLHNGSLQRYLAITIIGSIGIGLSGFYAQPDFQSGTRELLEVSPPAAIGWLLLVVTCIASVFMHHNRLLTLLLVGVVGLIVSLGFIYLSAPDLALTQISVEVVTVILMLLALNILPKETPKESLPGRKMRDGIVSIAAGLGVGGAIWAIMTRDLPNTISSYHLANSKTEGGGTNVVNVILVDFRGFDTFGEIIVLGIAALSIFALIETVTQGEAAKRLANWVVSNRRSADRHPMMMVVATRVMLPLSLMVGVYIFLRGHNEPGGGFIAGLVVSVALVMQYMASGFGWTQNRMKVNYHGMIGLGVIAAAITGVSAWVAGLPFLTSGFVHVHLPIVGEFELASAMGFDLGVFLTVVGAVMLALAKLSQVERMAEHVEINTEPMDHDPSLSAAPAATPGKEA
ncbi:monovalent cation/H+ antiporter subunit A [Thalassospira sp. A40-3]|uniref:monovalent cation/H+ antiporter subunit A n=1 Tax=Thalassospira sp. A40-3 TaxID=2785908 RepID=UPI0018CF2F67|nr:monovalent cation/H+ antiporter subunit A [Thalassospira sp. A40-3]QPO11294.1 monovalent cation/H+ antiporter subunit A [Thalassospira sp. A40-3]